MTMTISGSSGLIFPDGSGQETGIGRNRIINGAMVIDQRNAGAAVTIDQTGGTYTLDRWYGRDDSPGAYSIQQVSDAPTGFKNSLKITITTTGTPGAAQYGFVGTWIEGYNTADLGWGASGASTVTLSFWAKSSVTGQFGGTITNSAQDRTYPFSFTISSANTWEQKTVTITGDTSGTWLTTNGAGIGVNFAVGIGSNFLGTANTWTGSFKMSATGQTNLYATSAATLQFTGVQLEIGTSATPFERRLYNQELANCQRYFIKFLGNSIWEEVPNIYAIGSTTGIAYANIAVPTQMRTTPSVSQSGVRLTDYTGGFTISSISSSGSSFGGLNGLECAINSSSLTQYRVYVLQANNNASAYLTLSAEL